jgi:hypothetical protein
LRTAVGSPTIHSLNTRRAITGLLAAAIAVAAFWAYSKRGKGPAPKAEPTAIVDGATLDFSGGKAVVGPSASDKAAIETAVRQIDEATKSVTFPDEPAQKN